MVSWWDVFQAVADGTSIVPSCLWRIRDRCTVTSPKVVLKVWGRVPRRWMPAPPLPCRCCKDQFFVGLFDQDLEELTLDFQTGLMDVGLDLVGEMFVLGRHGQGHLQRQVERECLTVPVDGADV